MAIIGILAAIAIPGYIGMQEKARKGAIMRSATSIVPELQAWLQSARGGIGTQIEIDTNFDGNVSTVAPLDMTNAALLAYSNGIYVGVGGAYVYFRNLAMNEYSPWISGTDLWVYLAQGAAGNDDQPSATYRGLVVIGATTSGLRVVARDYSTTGLVLVNKIVSAD